MFSPQEDKNFTHPPSQEELLAEYRKSEENNPASLYYKRHLVRPKPHLLRALLFCFLALFSSALFGMVIFFIFKKIVVSILCGVAFLLLISVIFLKAILLWLVRFYQRFAPQKTRERCRYEPSCSEYMILALQKYGVIKGLSKGIRRLRRCKPPNGGFDPP